MASLRRRAEVAREEFWKGFNSLKRAEKAERQSRLKAQGQAETALAFGGADIMVAPLPPATIDVVEGAYRGLANAVYVAWPLDDGFVKIGVSNRIAERVDALQTANPRRLLLVAAFNEGTLGWTEPRLHARFQAHRASGEWFRIEGELLTWLDLRLKQAVAAYRVRDGQE